MREAEPKVVLRIKPDGLIEAETLGVKGEKCLDFIPLLEDLLEAEILSSSFTAEFHESDDKEGDGLKDDLTQW